MYGLDIITSHEEGYCHVGYLPITLSPLNFKFELIFRFSLFVLMDFEAMEYVMHF